MKKILSFIIMPIVLTAMAGCEKFLDLKPTDFVSPENYYNNESDLNAALVGIYDILGKDQVYGDAIPVMFSISDEGYHSRTYQIDGPEVYNFDAAEPKVNNMWRYLYEGIERANMLLENADKVTMDENEKKAIIGEARFLRAYFFYLLVDYWGDVPLKIHTTVSVSEVNIPRTPQKEIYAFILKEMEAAEGMVKTATQIGYGGRVSRTTVQGILARVCLKMAGQPLNDVSKYEDALKWAKKVALPEDGPKIHSLNPSFSNIFIKHCTDQYDIKESMWEVEYYGNRSGDFESGRIGNTIGIQCLDDVRGYAYGFINATFMLYKSYEAGDNRRDWTMSPFQYTYTTTNGINTVKDSTFFTATQIYNRNAAKWRRIYEKVLPRDKNSTPINFPLLRYADVLLMLAEAENEINGPTAIAKAAVKEVRDRANASDKTTAISSPEIFRDLVKEERFRELAFEGLRRHDLIRWGEFVTVMDDVGDKLASEGAPFTYGSLAGKNVTEKHKLLPIPISELSLNRAMVQNPGW